MTRHGFPAATTRGGTTPLTTLPAPMTEPEPIRVPARTIDRAPTKTSSPITTRSLSDGRGGGAYRRGMSLISWKSVSVTSTSAPNRTLAPTATELIAQIVVPLSPESLPIVMLASLSSVRSITGLLTPSAVDATLEISTDRSPIEMADPGASSTIGWPIIRTRCPMTTPRARTSSRNSTPDPVSVQPRHPRDAICVTLLNGVLPDAVVRFLLDSWTLS